MKKRRVKKRNTFKLNTSLYKNSHLCLSQIDIVKIEPNQLFKIFLFFLQQALKYLLYLFLGCCDPILFLVPMVPLY